MSRFIVVIILILSFVGGWYLKGYLEENPESKSLFQDAPKEKPFEKYTIENLSKTEIPKSSFTIKEILSEEKSYTSYLFELEFSPDLSGTSIKRTTGMINLPAGRQVFQSQKFPLIIMLRGYVDQKLYTTGAGTKNAGYYFAENGFITVAPDFLGYGGSDEEAGNIFETRFQTYTTVLSLIKALNQIGQWNKQNIFIWAHSNGGQVALTLLEITGNDYPTTFWAPVSKPFPYSILYYTDESEDRGKSIRRELAKFEEDYDVELYSLTNYLNKINTPLQTHQGLADDAVPLEWSNELTAKLKKEGKNVTYYTYPGTDHNMRPNWDIVIERDLEFFKKNTKD